MMMSMMMTVMMKMMMMRTKMTILMIDEIVAYNQAEADARLLLEHD